MGLLIPNRSCMQWAILVVAVGVSNGFQAPALGAFTDPIILDSRSKQSSSGLQYLQGRDEPDMDVEPKDFLLNLLAMTPRNSPTPQPMTREILRSVRTLEERCPTPDDQVLKELGGNWELLWTTQDQSSPESRRIGSFINPFENQSYSNNPEGEATGRSNPFLPRSVQDRLEKLGLVTRSASIQSTQIVDLKRQKATNVVAFGLANVRQRASVTVNIAFRPNRSDARRIDVQFDSFRIRITGSPVNLNFPLGLAGPIGWLRTTYIDENLRITRGHKGSVFILRRPRRAVV